MAENHHPDRNQPRAAIGQRLLWFGLLLAITVGFYWKLALTQQYVWFDHPDMAYLEIPRLGMQARAIHDGGFPLWNPYIWAGQPLIGQTQPGPLFPSTLIFYLSSLKGGYLRFSHLNALWVALHFLAAWFLYLLGRHLGLSRASSLIGGCIFGFGGFVGAVAWLDVLNGAIWAPLVLLFILRSENPLFAWPSAALGGLFLGIAWLSGHHELPILLSLMAAGVWIWVCRRDRRMIAPAAAFFVIAGMIGAAQVLPTFEFGKLSRRWVGLDDSVTWQDKIPYTVHTIYSLPAKGLLSLVIPGLGRYADATPFVGFVAMLLAAIAIISRWRNRAVRCITAIGVIGTVYSLGAATPLNGIMYSLLPVVDKARIPSRGVILISLAVAALAAIGLDAVLCDSLLRATRWVRFTAAGVGGILLILSIASKDVDNSVTMGGLICLCAAAVLAGWQSSALSRTATACALLGMSLIELTAGGPAFYSNLTEKDSGKFAKALLADVDVAEFLKKHPVPARAVVDDQVVPVNFGDWHGISMLHGYVAGTTVNILNHELHTPRTQDLYAVTHKLGKAPDQPEHRNVFTGASGVKVFERGTAFERVRLVHEARNVENWGYMRIAVQDPAVDLKQVALFLGDAPKLEPCAGEDRVEVIARGTDFIKARVSTACTALMVVAETNYPGWTAQVDGKAAPVLVPYGSLQGVIVPAGAHDVELRFRPRSVYAGAALCLLGLVLTAALVIRKPRLQ